MEKFAHCTPRAMAAWILLTLCLLLAGCAEALFRPTADSAPTAVLPTPLPVDQPSTPVRSRPVRFNSLSITEGLSQSVVNVILQDRHGFLWFGTQDGLNRYDGYTFTIYRSDPADPNSLSHNNILCLMEDREGRLWIGTLTGGLNRFDPRTGKFTRYRNDKKQPDSLGPGSVNAILEDRQGQIWIGTRGGGISRYNPETDAFDHFQNNAEDPDSLMYNAVIDLLEARDGSLWIATGKGLDRLDMETGRFSHYFYHEDDPHSLPGEMINRLLEDDQGRIWMAAGDKGLGRLDPSSGSVTRFEDALPEGVITSLELDRAGVLWVGMTAGGVCRMEQESEDFTCFRHNPQDRESLPINDVFSLYEDRSGNLWVGTYGGGVSRLDPGFKHFVNYGIDPANPDSLEGGLVFALLKDRDGYLWIGREGSGLDRLDRRTGEITRFLHDPSDPASISSNKIHVLHQDHTGAIWIGTSAGLDRMGTDGRIERIVPGRIDAPGLKPGNVSALVEDAQGGLWIGVDGGLLYFDPSHQGGKIPGTLYKNDPENPKSLIGNGVASLLLDSKNRLWIGTMGRGLDSLDIASGAFTHHYSDPDDPVSLSDPYVMSLFEDSSGTIWAGTTAGLNRLVPGSGDRPATFRHYRVKDGLPNDFIYAIEQDKQGRLWISTNLGLSRMDPKTETFRNYDAKDGLQSNEFNSAASYAAADGEMFFGGIQGVTGFYPDQILENPYVPPVALTSLTRRGEPLETGEEIVLRYPDNQIEFEFAALNYIRPENNRYAYLLEGFDTQWNEIGARRSGAYTNLPGGTYTLRVRGSNNDGLWNEQGAALRVRVVPPFWQTWVFRSGALLLLVAGVAGGVRLRVRSVESRNLQLEKLVRTRTVEIERLYEQTRDLAIIEERNRLARDLHDSAKQKAFAALAQLGAAGGLVKRDPARAHTALLEAETLVYEVIEELTFLIQEMYPAALKEKGLPSVLREYLYEWEGRTGIQVDYQIQGERQLALQTEQSIYRIVQEALANVARHSQATKVDVVVQYQEQWVNICINDNGSGFDMSRRPAGVGLRSMRERMTMIGGTITVESMPGQGTRVTASAPAKYPQPEKS